MFMNSMFYGIFLIPSITSPVKYILRKLGERFHEICLSQWLRLACLSFACRNFRMIKIEFYGFFKQINNISKLGSRN